jgi:large subunit ribosomal protein L25
MSNIAKLAGKSRKSLGTASARRLRAEGLVPCNVYGHKQDAAAVFVESEAIGTLVRSGTRVVDLDVEGRLEKALVKDVQWDTFSVNVMHVDFLRVAADERVKVEVPLQLKGTAPGVVAGGILEIPHHTVTVDCLAIETPDYLQVRIGNLNIGDAVHVSDLQDIPEGIKILTSPETVLVHVVEPKAAPEPVPAGEAGVQPALVTPPGKEKEEAGKAN